MMSRDLPQLYTASFWRKHEPCLADGLGHHLVSPPGHASNQRDSRLSGRDWPHSARETARLNEIWSLTWSVNQNTCTHVRCEDIVKSHVSYTQMIAQKCHRTVNTMQVWIILGVDQSKAKSRSGLTFVYLWRGSHNLPNAVICTSARVRLSRTAVNLVMVCSLKIFLWFRGAQNVNISLLRKREPK